MGRMLVIAAVVAAAGACRAPASPVGVEETEPEDRGADGAARGVGGGGPGSVIDSLPDPEPGELDGETASRLVRLSLECVEREYPNKPSGVWVEDASGRPPRELHPAFFGCFDWHSAVHAHWAMVRVLRTHPDIEEAGEIRDVLDRHLAPGPIAAEVAYLEAEHNALFERPYGWGWYLRLAAELHELGDDPAGARWAAAVQPLVDLIAGRLVDYLDRLSLPVRAGTHASTAYALVHAHDHATTVGDDVLRESIEERARDYYLGDVACPVRWEPSGEDFISPCLVEADLMRRVLEPDEFVSWLDAFLPAPGSSDLDPLLRPPEIRDPEDPRIGHLIGLGFQRATAWAGVASALPEGDPRREVYMASATLHREDALERMWKSGYGGEHWLASFAVLALTCP